MKIYIKIFDCEGGRIMVLVENEFFEVYESLDKIFIRVHKEGFKLKDFETIMKQQRRLKLTSFQTLREALQTPAPEPYEIGIWLPVLVLSISKDSMTVSLQVNDTEDALVRNEAQLNKQIRMIADSMGLRCKLNHVTPEQVINEKNIIVGKGIEPERGADAVLNYFESPVIKPMIREDGRADYFDMNFICEIEENQWLGEKIPATEGESGINVYGEIVTALAGKDASLRYDPNSVYESEEEDRIVLRARHNGVLDISDGTVKLLQHLTIQGDVGIETGNLDFKGSILIKGTVTPGYRVRALGDISIEGNTGVTSAELIESIAGDVNIRGGIFGNHTMVVRAGKNIYAKHANDVLLEAMEDIYISNYAMGSNLVAQNVYLDEHRGKIIGGETSVTQSIKVAYAGNPHERRTNLSIVVPDRTERMAEARAFADESEKLKEEYKKREIQVAQLESFYDKMTQEQRFAFENSKQTAATLKKRIIQLDEQIQTVLLSVRMVGQEEISVTKEAYPGTVLQIGKFSSMLKKTTCGSFKIEGGKLNV